jgi:hypothetical protein
MDLALLIGFCIMFLSTGAYYGMSLKYPIEKRTFHYVTMFVTGIASIAYLIMAFDGGKQMLTLESGEQRKFFYVRYLECVRRVRSPLPRVRRSAPPARRCLRARARGPLIAHRVRTLDARRAAGPSRPRSCSSTSAFSPARRSSTSPSSSAATCS